MSRPTSVKYEKKIVMFFIYYEYFS